MTLLDSKTPQNTIINTLVTSSAPWRSLVPKASLGSSAFYITAPDGKRKLKVQTFDSLKYPAERDVRKAVEGQLSALNAGTLGGKLAATLGTIIDRYMAEDFLTLRHSTQTTNKNLIDLHVRPRFSDLG
jgi:hypothetical protein